MGNSLSTTRNAGNDHPERFAPSRKWTNPDRFDIPEVYSQLPTGIQRKASCACGGGCPSCQTTSTDLKVSQPNDPAEIEADQIAERVMGGGAPVIAGKSADEGMIHKKRTGPDAGDPVSNDISSRVSSSRGGGNSLDAGTRSFMESRFGANLSGVRIHTGGEAAELNNSLSAQAFTIGTDIFFSAGQYQPGTESGNRLLAHELVHVMQGSNGKIHRCVNPKKNDPIYDAAAKKIQDHSVYKALAPTSDVPDPKGIADRILVEAKKKNDCLYLLGKLTQLFDTPKKAGAAIATATRTAVAAEHKKEMARVGKQDKTVTDREEDASKAAAAKLKPVVGKFGGGSYLMDKSDLGNIVVKIKIFLTKASGATDDDVKKVKDMQDGIEKVASVKGFILDVDFVSVEDSETFKVEVNPEAWTVATEWGSGSTPTAFAHEIFHLMAFSLDRYNYIESHSTNTDMEVPVRLVWFEQQLLKPAGFDDPKSLMSSGSKPTEEDVCLVIGEGSVPTDCVKDRKKAVKP